MISTNIPLQYPTSIPSLYPLIFHSCIHWYSIDYLNIIYIVSTNIEPWNQNKMGQLLVAAIHRACPPQRRSWNCPRLGRCTGADGEKVPKKRSHKAMSSPEFWNLHELINEWIHKLHIVYHSLPNPREFWQLGWGNHGDAEFTRQKKHASATISAPSDSARYHVSQLTAVNGIW